MKIQYQFKDQPFSLFSWRRWEGHSVRRVPSDLILSTCCDRFPFVKIFCEPRCFSILLGNSFHCLKIIFESLFLGILTRSDWIVTNTNSISIYWYLQEHAMSKTNDNKNKNMSKTFVLILCKINLRQNNLILAWKENLTKILCLGWGVKFEVWEPKSNYFSIHPKTKEKHQGNTQVRWGPTLGEGQ